MGVGKGTNKRTSKREHINSVKVPYNTVGRQELNDFRDNLILNKTTVLVPWGRTVPIHDRTRFDAMFKKRSLAGYYIGNDHPKINLDEMSFILTELTKDLFLEKLLVCPEGGAYAPDVNPITDEQLAPLNHIDTINIELKKSKIKPRTYDDDYYGNYTYNDGYDVACNYHDYKFNFSIPLDAGRVKYIKKTFKSPVYQQSNKYLLFPYNIVAEFMRRAH